MGRIDVKVENPKILESIDTEAAAVQKIKQNLIRNAKVKTSYRKLREREQLNTPKPIYNPLNAQDEEPSSLELHPDRQVMLEESASVPPPQSQSKEARSSHPRQKRPKPQPFKRETQLAQERKEEREARQKEIEENNRKRQVKIEERERFRKAMAKARSGGRNGQRKLGRESKVLLEKVRRIVDK